VRLCAFQNSNKTSSNQSFTFVKNFDFIEMKSKFLTKLKDVYENAQAQGKT